MIKKLLAWIPIGMLLTVVVFLIMILARARAGQPPAPLAPATPPAATEPATALPITDFSETPTDPANPVPFITAAPDPEPTPSQVIDLAPSVPDSEKTFLYIQHPDGSQDEVRLTGDMVAGYLSQLPPGDQLVAEILPAYLHGHHPPPPGPFIGTFPSDVPSPNPPTPPDVTGTPPPYPPPTTPTP